MKISEKIFLIMEVKNISQLELAQSTGIGQATISDWKTKKTNPSASKIIPICVALDCEPYDILLHNGRMCD